MQKDFSKASNCWKERFRFLYTNPWISRTRRYEWENKIHLKWQKVPTYHVYYHVYLNSKKLEIKVNCYDALQIFILSLGVFTLLRLSLLYRCTHVSYVTFNTDVNLFNKKKKMLLSTWCISTYLSLVVLGLLILSECENEQIILFIIRINPNIGNLMDLSLTFIKSISRVISGTLLLYIFCISITPATCTLCLIIFQIWCHWYV